MNAIERLNSFLKGEELDRLPVHPLMMRQASRLAGYPYSRYCQEYKVQADAMIFSARTFGAECVHPSGYPYCEARAYGLSVDYPYDDLPIAREHLIKSLDDLHFIRPLNPEEHDFMMDRVKGVSYFRQMEGDNLIICGHHEGILAEYSDLRGLGEACMDLFDIPEDLHGYFAIIRENACRWGKLQAEAGAHFISIGDAACSQIGPDLYREFIFPHHKKMIEYYHQMDKKVKLHICGDTTALLPMLIETGADIIDIDHMVSNIAPFTEMLQPHQLFCGNLDPVEILLQGTPGTIKKEAERWIIESKGRGILSGGCEIPLNTPDGNLQALLEASEELVPLWKGIRSGG